MIERTWAPDEEPAVIVARADELLGQVREFVASPMWADVQRHIDAQVAAALRDFEQGTGSDAELRGRIQALRLIQHVPGTWETNLRHEIKNNRGRLTI